MRFASFRHEQSTEVICASACDGLDGSNGFLLLRRCIENDSAGICEQIRMSEERQMFVIVVQAIRESLFGLAVVSVR